MLVLHWPLVGDVENFQVPFSMTNGFITPVNSSKMRAIALTELFLEEPARRLTRKNEFSYRMS